MQWSLTWTDRAFAEGRVTWALYQRDSLAQRAVKIGSARRSNLDRQKHTWSASVMGWLKRRSRLWRVHTTAAIRKINLRASRSTRCKGQRRHKFRGPLPRTGWQAIKYLSREGFRATLEKVGKSGSWVCIFMAGISRSALFACMDFYLILFLNTDLMLIKL